jgi:2-polyprenyl-3-methyl-5-hydroxy-6-metoxy-1,4-benzoquinol methylase
MLRVRATTDELMDADDLDAAIYGEVLHDLATVNSVTLARRPTLSFLDRVKKAHKGPLKILDVGYGDGDMLRRIARWAKASGIDTHLVGIDLNPNSAAAAARSTPVSLRIDYLTGDYADLAGQGWDVILSSLVAHHMTQGQLSAFLRFMEKEARVGWLVNDLHRHGFAWLGFPILAWLMRCHPIVRHDGQLSIARSYRPREWKPLLDEAGIKRARVFRAFPFRLCVEQIRSS